MLEKGMIVRIKSEYLIEYYIHGSVKCCTRMPQVW